MEVHGYTSGYEIEIHKSGDAARLRYFIDYGKPLIVSDWLEIKSIDNEYFIDPDGYNISLNSVGYFLGC